MMERTTIYLDDLIRYYLLEMALEESKKRGKRVGMAEIIRKALIEYMRQKGKPVEDVITRMLSTKGSLGSDFEKRVKAIQEEFNKWKI